jgi:hypothetical protein
LFDADSRADCEELHLKQALLKAYDRVLDLNYARRRILTNFLRMKNIDGVFNEVKSIDPEYFKYCIHGTRLHVLLSAGRYKRQKSAVKGRVERLDCGLLDIWTHLFPGYKLNS